MQLSPFSFPFSKSVNVIYQPTHVSGPYQVVLIGVQSVDLPGSLGLEQTWVTVREAISLFAPSNLFNPPPPVFHQVTHLHDSWRRSHVSVLRSCSSHYFSSKMHY